jgi:hypothetical protein
MAITLQKTNLPGSRFILRDGTVSITPPAITGDTVLIIGPSLDGPVNVPLVLGTQVTNPEAVFGPIAYNSAYPPPDGDPGKYGGYSGNALVKAVKEAVLGGASSIIMVRCGGTTATGTSLFSGTILVQALNPGMAYNGTTIAVQATAASGATVVVTQPTVRGLPFTMYFTPQTSLESLALSVNTNPANNSITLLPQSPASLSTIASLVSPVNVTTTLGGPTGYGSLSDDYSGFSKAALYNVITAASSGTFAQIADVEADILHVAGIYADDDVANSPNYSFITDLATFCYSQSKEVYPMIGVIGVRPSGANNPISIAGRVTNLTTVLPPSSSGTGTSYVSTPTLKLCVPYFIEEGIQIVDSDQTLGQADAGGYVSCHAGPDVIFPDATLGSYIDNPAAYYAGLLATLAPQQGATYYQLPSTVQLWYTYSRAQRNTLNQGINFALAASSYTQNIQAGGAYVTFFNRDVSPANSVMSVTEDVTCSERNNDFSVTQSLRVVHEVMDSVKIVCDQFIGKPNNATVIATLNGQIQGVLNAIAAQGALQGGQGNGYIFTISQGPTPALGQLTITLNLKLAWEIRFITTIVQIGG